MEYTFELPQNVDYIEQKSESHNTLPNAEITILGSIVIFEKATGEPFLDKSYSVRVRFGEC